MRFDLVAQSGIDWERLGFLDRSCVDFLLLDRSPSLDCQSFDFILGFTQAFELTTAVAGEEFAKSVLRVTFRSTCLNPKSLPVFYKEDPTNPAKTFLRVQLKRHHSQAH